MQNVKIVNLATPTLATDAATKGYVDGKAADIPTLTQVLGQGNSAGGSQINMNSQKIINLL